MMRGSDIDAEVLLALDDGSEMFYSIGGRARPSVTVAEIAGLLSFYRSRSFIEASRLEQEGQPPFKSRRTRIDSRLRRWVRRSLQRLSSRNVVIKDRFRLWRRANVLERLARI